MFSLPLSLLATPAAAQLLSERVELDRRICTYVGTEIVAGDRIVPRTFGVALGQGCPAVAPFRDPNAPPPPTAALLRVENQAGQRVCIYGQAGVEYRLGVPITVYCPMTPALHEEARRQGFARR